MKPKNIEKAISTVKCNSDGSVNLEYFIYEMYKNTLNNQNLTLNEEIKERIKDKCIKFNCNFDRVMMYFLMD